MSKEEKKEQGVGFKKGNFSCNLEAMTLKKDEFMSYYAGKVNTDLNKLWAELQKAKTAYFKTTDGKAHKASLKPEKGE